MIPRKFGSQRILSLSAFLLCLSFWLDASVAVADNKIFEISGMTKNEHIEAIKAKVCPLATVGSCSISLGKLRSSSNQIQSIAERHSRPAVEKYRVAAPPNRNRIESPQLR